MISLVIPVHNEAASAHPLAREIAAAMARTAYEIVFVDDGSTDASAETLQAAATAAAIPSLRVLRHGTRAGQSAAIRTGVKAAQGTWIATLDGDGQNDPADIPRLSSVVRGANRPTLAVGHRIDRKDGVAKRVASRLANAVRSRFLGDGTPDSGCGLKVFPRDLYLDLPYFDHMHRFLPALARRAGADVVSVPVNHRPRVAGRSHYGIAGRAFSGVVDLVGVAWLMRRGAFAASNAAAGK